MKVFNFIELVGGVILMFLSLAVPAPLGVFLIIISLVVTIATFIELISTWRSRNRWGECSECSRPIFEVGFERKDQIYLPEITSGKKRCIECINPQLRRS